MPESAFLPEPFTVRASAEALADLRVRLRATRWPDAPEDAGWSLGTDLAYLRDLVAYWADGFDWAAREKALSECTQRNCAPSSALTGPSYSRLSEIARDGTANDRRKIGRMFFPLHRKAMTWPSSASNVAVRLEFRPLRICRV
jgi:Epoxide hydrolase N terminus